MRDMLCFKAADLDAKLQYKLLSGSIVPRPIAWLSTWHKEKDIVNLAPFSFTSIAAKSVPLVSIAFLRTDSGEQKHSAWHLSQHPEGVIHVVTEDIIAQMNQTAANLPLDQSELAAAGLTPVASAIVQVPGVAEAAMRLEVKVYDHHIVRGYADEPISDLFLLEVVAFHITAEVFDAERQYIDYGQLKPVSRLAGQLYANLTAPYVLKRPE